MSDVFDELTKDVKDEKVQKAFVNLLPKIVYITIAVVLIMFIKNWLHSKQLARDMKIGDMFHKTLLLKENGERELAQESLDNLLKIVDNSQKDLIELYELKALLEEKETLVSQEKLKKIFESPASKELTRAYSRLLWSAIELNKSSSEVINDEIERNFALSASKGGIFYGNGSIIYSLWLMKNKRDAEAKVVLEEVMKVSQVPSSIKSSASAILSNLSN